MLVCSLSDFNNIIHMHALYRHAVDSDLKELNARWEQSQGKKCLKQEHSVNHMMLSPLSASGNEGVEDVVSSAVVSTEPDLKSF